MSEKFGRLWLMTMVLVSLAVIAAACGDDGSSSAGGSEPEGDEPASTVAEEPIAGGEAVLLVFTDIGTLDPVRFTGSGGSDGQQAFALYGALVTLNPETSKADPVLAESFEPTTDFLTWTLKLRTGMTFSDGSAFDAAAVKFNWDRIRDPANRSPALSALRSVTEMTVIDPLTLTIKLSTPNAHFDKAVARGGANYIASAQAIQSGTDLTSQAVGAGPFLLDQWLRDDHMVMSRNPAWKGSDGPNLDKLTFRVVGNEDQRVDTFVTGQVDGFTFGTTLSRARGLNERDGSQAYAVDALTHYLSVFFNNGKPPFDDVRMRKVFVQGVDWQASNDTVYGPDTPYPGNMSLEGTPWYTPDGELPPYDPAAAQILIDDYLAEKGLDQLDITLIAIQTSVQTATAKFAQTSLSQLENVNVTVEINDAPTGIGKVLTGNYEVALFGSPFIDPEPGLYNSTYSQSPNNYTKYKNADVDKWLDEARTSRDMSERQALYANVFEQMADDIPFFQYARSVSGWVLGPELHGGAVYEDSILRTDLLWLK